MAKRGWPKGKPRKAIDPVQAKEQAIEAGEAKQAVEKKQADKLVDETFQNIKHSGDPTDKNLYGAMYDETYSSQAWDSSNPMSVPPDIVKNNPGMRFYYRAADPKNPNHLRKGDHYNGWQRYNSNKYPNGYVVGGDLILSFMPEEAAQKINTRYQDESTERIRSMQQDQVEALDRAAAELSGKGVEFRISEPGSRFQSEDGRTAKYPVGVTVGPSKSRNRKTGQEIKQYRGYHPEELAELAAKTQEKRSRNRKIFT